ncbi:hypothetical protein HX004_07595 [Myroides sp. 1354]|uniref:hypothetical protein n=1 Tax=unclassified Myroides TaxID=2642485 RepID=UPI0025767CD0|nr:MULTISPECIES: hypothetical protein [unclassified Myroides]MDM1044924.1 hypothetical protein [Myroides sp. R163-1]MDM1055637.1 hypothetical protein [Myroides sp. 1354]MDM1068934.1 hypothetical protein [Myroides sp. 1372]
MKRAGSLAVMTILSVLLGCNKHDDSSNGPKEDLVGVWRLREKIENDRLITLGICDLKEVYVFGQTQYSHETYSQEQVKYKTTSIGIFGSDDDYYTEIDNTVNCKSNGVSIGTWIKIGGDKYQLKGTNTTENREYSISFSADKRTFYLEKETYLGGKVYTSYGVYKKQ